MEVDLTAIEKLAESAERRAKEIHQKYLWTAPREGDVAASLLNDFFYWSGKATSYRGIVAMAELQMVVEDELDEEPSCP